MRRWLLFFLFIGLVLIAGILWLKPSGSEAFGKAFALCPGPDLYGYRCENGDQFAYIDANRSLQLFDDDATVSTPLPFPFTFYGESYQQVTVSSNGNFQFGTANSSPSNRCLDDVAPRRVGEMVAVYWDDLDPSVGGDVEVAVVGELPNRIFVIEWDDVPYFNREEQVTVEAQLFEGSNDIILLYQQVSAGNAGNGSSATIGLQSGKHGVALQYGCNLPTITDTRGLHFLHPAEPNSELPATSHSSLVLNPSVDAHTTPLVKGVTAELLTAYQYDGEAGLTRLQQRSMNQSPPLFSQWRWADVTGDGDLNLLWLAKSDSHHPERTQLVILSSDGEQVLGDWRLSKREMPAFSPHFDALTDWTGDKIMDVRLFDALSDRYWLVTWQDEALQLTELPAHCWVNGGNHFVRDKQDCEMRLQK